ncbi:unnamed protein product [Phaedon cochleariae]|uniref:DUF4776 domain-containing protein n=1 Tax=Phaedon cochleariae TaxID=80249 RepID=A0A9P0DU82_PHACE|nr:unnamed protein product [Phaedon cochleariae]
MASVGKLFLLEVLVYKIHLQPNFENIPKKNDVAFNIRFSDIINSNIIPEDFKLQGGEMDEGLISSLLTINMGKTCLIVHKPKDLVSELRRCPLEVGFQIKRKTIGTALIPFKTEFADMVNIYESIGVVKSVEYNGISDLKKTPEEEKIGTIEIFLRMSCYGDNIDTDFRWFEVTNEYVFMEPKTTATFKIESFDLMTNTNVTPITSLYNPAVCTPVSTTTKRLSWTELFGGGKSPGVKLSVAPIGLDDCPIHMDISRRQSKLQHTISMGSAFDVVSLVFRPPENKFFDFLNMVSAEVTTKEDETTVTLSVSKENMNKKQLHIQDEVISYDVEKLKNIIVMDEDDEEDPALELTADKIARKLCKNKDCPAAKKFKEYGIGPLATGKGLGTLYGDVEPPTTYGLSHTYGTFANYGPYGVFSRPKSPDQPFIPPKNALETPKPPCSNRKEKTCRHGVRRLRGGGLPNDALDSSMPSCKILRLRGGGQLEIEALPGPKSPFLECKPVMDQFDQILAAYKKALGPCGQPTCPHAQTLAEAQCEKYLEMTGRAIKKGPPEKTDSVSCQSIPCTMEECPYKENKNRFPAGCGSPRCAYAAYKLGLVDDDAAIELQFLPPAVSGKCGHPKCEYPLKPDLPPIHWDCPDPLPKGNCKNLNCPFLPPDLKVMKCKVPKKGPCGSTSCPYALPPPCDVPSCPFRQKPCPFLEQQQQGDMKASCSMNSKDGEICENPDCPFANNGDDQSACFQDENLKGEFQTCANPGCPFANKTGNGKGDDACINVKCPSKNNRKKDNDARKSKKKSTSRNCDNPDCPFADSKKKKIVQKKSSSVCENPDCPFAKKTLDTENTSKSSSLCDNPDCPFAKSSQNTTQSNLCANPDCPFANKSSTSSSTSSSEKCSHKSANCENGSVCSNPNCPYTGIKEDPICNDPFCPYLQPLPSCGVRNCPYEPVPGIYCPSPNCPAMSVGTVQQSKSLREQRQQERNSTSNQKSGENVVGQTDIVLETQMSVVRKSKEAVRASKEQPDSKEQPQAVKGNGNGKKKRGKFVYSMGDKYPGVKVGHKECVTPMFNVPPKMGWLWNIHTPILRLKPRRGWKPGAIVKTIAQRIRAHRQLKGLGMLHVPKFRKNVGGSESDPEVNVSPKPTLHIQKKDGAYWITMNPLKDPKTLAENEDPYMECTPMQFKITKNKNKPKDDNDEDGSRLCCCEPEDESSSSDSELDIEFTPPAGIIHPERFKKKKNVIHCDTQYNPDDFEVKKDIAKGKSKSQESQKGKGKEKGKGKGKKGKK